MWQAALTFVLAHWMKLLSGVTFVSFCSFITRWLSTRKQAKLKKLARRLRYYADEVRMKEPNVKFFPEKSLAAQLGDDAKDITEVLEWMEEKGWAVRVEYPVGCWRIGASNSQHEFLPLARRWT
jgi:hypothetical protein